jgi:hypothetical protein
MQGIGEMRIGRNRLPVFRDGLFVMTLENEIKRSVIVVLSQLARRLRTGGRADRIVRHS